MPFSTSIAQFHGHLEQLCGELVGKPHNAGLADWLNAEHGAGSSTFAALQAAHHLTITQGRAGVLYLLPEGGIAFTR